MATEIERKFLVAGTPDLAEVAAASGGVDTADLEQRYLDAPPGVERRVRRQRSAAGERHVQTEKRPVPGTNREREESERDMTAAEYAVAARSTQGAVIRKRRHRFTWDGQRFELDQFLEPVEAWLLEIELVGVDDEVRLPPFLAVEREVTDDPAWRNAAIARRAAPPS